MNISETLRTIGSWSTPAIDLFGVTDPKIRMVATGVQYAFELVARLIDHGIAPDVAIERWLSMLPDVAAVDAAINAEIKRRSQPTE